MLTNTCNCFAYMSFHNDTLRNIPELSPAGGDLTSQSKNPGVSCKIWHPLLQKIEKSDTIEASRANSPTPGLCARRLAAGPREKVGQTGFVDAPPCPAR